MDIGIFRDDVSPSPAPTHGEIPALPWCQPVDSASTPSTLNASWAWVPFLTSQEVLWGLVKAQKSDSSFLRSQSRLGNAVLTSVSHQNTVGETSSVVLFVRRWQAAVLFFWSGGYRKLHFIVVTRKEESALEKVSQGRRAWGTAGSDSRTVTVPNVRPSASDLGMESKQRACHRCTVKFRDWLMFLS